MGEVDHAQHAVDHGVAHGDQRVDAALGQSEDDEVDPVVGRVDALGQRGHRTPHDHDQHEPADQPHDEVGGGQSISDALQHKRIGLSPRRRER